MITSEMLNNYNKALKQKFNAVCLDIDGTLTIKNSKKIDPRTIEMIAKLIKRNIPIVFITGRGETGLLDLKIDIYDILKNNYNVTENEFKQLYILINDGARLFYTDYNKSLDIFNSCAYISSIDSINNLNEFNKDFITSLNKENLNDRCNISYSIDNTKNLIINVRIIFKTLEKEKINDVLGLVDRILTTNNFNDIFITRGIYEDKVVIQLGTAKKDVAIEAAERLIGIPQKSMIRIGDCGDSSGNDYSMLNCEQGFSTDKTSGSITSCFPIIDDNGNILKNADATLFLIEKARILPTVCLESANKDKYRLEYAKIEKNINKNKDSNLNYFNFLINNNLNVINGIEDIFDKDSGSVKIPMCDWELINDSHLKRLFAISSNEKLLYSMRDNKNYLLRGSNTYYNLLANRKSCDGHDYTSKYNIKNWYVNYLNFLNQAIYAVNNTKDFNDCNEKRILLGLLDNIRNVLLVLLNHKLVSDYQEKNVLLSINNTKDYETLALAIIDVLKEMSFICFSNGYSIDNKKIRAILYKSYKCLLKEYQIQVSNFVDKDYSKEYRTYREIDNFAENYISIYLNDNEYNINSKINACGLSYGGIELPFIYKIINKNINDILLIKFNKQTSGYTNKQLIDLRKFDINDCGGIDGIDKIDNRNLILLDDNILTGKTLQLACNSLYDCGFDVKNICVVRYPGINRLDQMFMKNHTAVNYKLFFNYITGLHFESPYSWRDENNLDKYKDSLGVFDLNRKKIIECLIKNHDYNELSEVEQYRKGLSK